MQILCRGFSGFFSGYLALFAVFRVVDRAAGLVDRFNCDHALLDAFEGRQLEHDVDHDVLQYRAQGSCSCASVYGYCYHPVEGFFGEFEFYAVHFEEALILLHKRVFRFYEDVPEG